MVHILIFLVIRLNGHTNKLCESGVEMLICRLLVTDRHAGPPRVIEDCVLLHVEERVLKAASIISVIGRLE